MFIPNVVSIRLDDPETVKCSFSFRKGDRVAPKRVDGLLDLDMMGEIIDGRFEGPLWNGFYTDFYVVKRLKNGQFYRANSRGLKKSSIQTKPNGKNYREVGSESKIYTGILGGR